MRKFIVTFSLLSVSVIVLLSACSTSNPEPSPTDPRSQFLGKWGVSETPLKNYYIATISVDPNLSNGVLIGNFAASNAQAHALVSGNSIALTSNISLSNGWTVSGSGNFSSGKITFSSYSIFDGADLKYYSAVFTKQ